MAFGLISRVSFRIIDGTFIDRLRNRSYRLLDYFQGKKVKANYDEIKFMLNNYHAKEVRFKREKYLLSILNHAVETVPYYSEYKNFNSINNFPVVNKNEIAENFNNFSSSAYINKKNHLIYTSGSTGVPFKTYHCKNKYLRHNAEIIYLGERANYMFGEKLIYFKMWPKLRSVNFIRNVYMHSVLALEDGDMPKLLNTFKGKKRIGLLGYSSAFEKICLYLDKTKAKPLKNCNVVSMVCMSERLNEYTKIASKKYFNTTLVSRYSSMEFGIIAQEEIDMDGYFKINSANFLVEIFDLDKDVLAKKGAYGRIVVTDFFNRAVPMIRYDIGDIAKIEFIKNEEGFEEPYLVNIEGRKLDVILDTKGQIVPSQISCYIAKFGDFKQFQFVQSAKKNYELRLNTNSEVEKKQELIDTFKSVLGDDAEIKIVYVSGIPLLGSGKKKEVLNEYIASL